jgi:hypothetical protein
MFRGIKLYTGGNDVLKPGYLSHEQGGGTRREAFFRGFVDLNLAGPRGVVA